MENIDLINQYLDSFKHSINELQPEILQLISESFEDRLNTSLTPVERIKLSNGYAYILTSLCFAYLKSVGVDTNKHPIMEDLTRVKAYMKRLSTSEQELKNNSKENQIDTSVTKRFIQAALKNNGTGNSTVIKGVPEPAISKVSFQGTHTKFDDEKKKDDSSSSDDEVTEIQDEDEKKQIDAKHLSKSVNNQIRNQLKKKKQSSIRSKK